MKQLSAVMFTLAIMLSIQSRAQDMVSIPDNMLASPGDQVSIPLQVNLGNEGDICGFHFRIQFNGAVLEFIGEDNVHASVVQNLDVTENGGSIDITWFDANPITAGDNIETLLELEFTFLGGQSDIVFGGPGYPGPSNITDCTEDTAEIDTVFSDGFIQEIVPDAPVPLANWAIYLSVSLMVIVLGVFAYRRFL